MSNAETVGASLLAKNKLFASSLAPTNVQQTFLRQLAEGYAWVLLLPSRHAGMLLMAITFAVPLLALPGLFAVIVAWLSGRWMRASETLLPVYVFNGLLVGLNLAAHYQPGIHLYLLLLPAGILSAMLTGWLATALWRYSQLPVLSLPFVFCAWLIELAATSYAMLLPQPVAAFEATGWLSAFAASLGSVFSLPDAILGALLFLVLLFTSRILALLAVLGFVVGMGWQALLGDGLSADLLPAWSFNSVLAAMAVGGLFTVPGRKSFVLGALAALLAALLAAALTRLLAPLGLSPLALPFLLSTWICLLAAARVGKPALVGERVLLPEITLEEARLSRARLGDAASVGLTAPFFGEWQVSQGVDGEHTHRGIWRNALDFIVTVEGLSFQHDGKQLKDYFCYELPLVSPCYGMVVRVENAVPDNLPGEVNLRQNWGNFVLIRLYSGNHVLLAHLRQGSVTVLVGDHVIPGDALGNCGNSGRSPQPHLHLSLVNGDHPGAATLPFHLAGVLLKKQGGKECFRLWSTAVSGDTVVAAWLGAVRPIPLKVGQGMSYRARNEDGVWVKRRIITRLTLDGRYQLVADSGARCLCAWNGSLFACYAREGVADEFFDLWMLSAGCTPASEHAVTWHDQPPVRLLPKGVLGLAGWLLYPVATQLDATYQRAWDDARQCWLQTSNFGFAGNHLLETSAEIDFEHGLISLAAKADGKQWEMELTGIFQAADIGVPESEWSL